MYFKVFCALIYFSTFGVIGAWAQTGSITGMVTDETNDPLSGANIVILGTEMGAAAAKDGKFTLINIPIGVYTLKASFIGFIESEAVVEVVQDEETVVTFSLMEKALPAEALVVSASRKEQKLTAAPATITVVTARNLLKSSGFTYAEQLARLKGVDTYRSGIDNISINTRGFMAAFNYRTQLIADGRNATLVGGDIGLTNILPVARKQYIRKINKSKECLPVARPWRVRSPWE